MSAKKVLVSFPEKFLEIIDNLAEYERVSRSEILRIGINHYIKSYGLDDKVRGDSINEKRK